MIRWDREQQRVWLFGWRCHHGMVGATIAVLGVFLMWEDRKDFREWLLSHE